MKSLLTVLAAGLAAYLFFCPVVPVEQVEPLQYGIVGVLGLLFLLQVIEWLSGGKAGKVAAPEPEKMQAPAETEPAASRPSEGEAEVVHFLGRLQEKGRLVDFAMDDITPYTNEQVGAAARVVHQGCKEVLQSCFDILPVHPGEERESISLAADFDARSYQLIGKVPENPPYEGTVLHRGWKTSRVNLPRLAEEGADSSTRDIIVPAEVEMS